MFDLSVGKLLVIGVIALFLVGPDKPPQYAAQLARWVRVGRSLLDDAKGRMKDELGPEFDDVDWASLDPCRYHPRRLIADAWNAADAAPRPERRRPLDAGTTGPDLLDLLMQRPAPRSRPP